MLPKYLHARKDVERGRRKEIIEHDHCEGCSSESYGKGVKAGGLELRKCRSGRVGSRNPVRSVLVRVKFSSASLASRMNERLQSWPCLGRDEEDGGNSDGKVAGWRM